MDFVRTLESKQIFIFLTEHLKEIADSSDMKEYVEMLPEEQQLGFVEKCNIHPNPIAITNTDDLLEKLLPNKSSLIVVKNAQDYAMKILEDSQKKSLSVFYIDSPDQVDFTANDILIKKNGLA
ncbi:MAG: hypothetical protein ACJAW3_000136 [Lentimonas sp.]|jgi:hypothetical protein